MMGMGGGGPMHLMWSNAFNPEKPHIQRKVQWARLASFFKPYLRDELLIFVCIVFIAVLSLLPPLFTKWLIDSTLHNGDMHAAVGNVIGMVLAAVGAALFTVYQGFLNARVGEGILRDLRTALVGHMQKMSLTFFTNTKTGEIMNRVSNDVDNIDNVLTGTIQTIVTNIVSMLTTMITIFWLDWRLALISLAVIPLMILPLAPVGQKMYLIRKDTREKRDEIESITQQTLSLSGITLIKSFVRERFEQQRFRAVADALMHLEVRLAMVGRWFMASMGAMTIVGPAIVWLAGAYFVINHTATIGTVVAFVAYLNRLYSPASALASIQVQIVSALAVFERIMEYLDLDTEIEKEDATVLPDIAGRVQFDHVNFGYSADRMVLNDIDILIEPGQMAAFVGRSGAGKTTITGLVPRFYDVSEGTVSIDGVDVRDWSLASLRSHIGIVTQETYLFHDTVKANLLYGREDATEDQLISAAQAANIHDVIMALPKGYDTMVGERGHKLSGGERQRLAIARALLKDPRILILDEATSALDSYNESLIQQALNRLMTGRTSLVIAHRLSTIIRADVIYVVQNGTIIERGRHLDLLHSGGAYADLYREQFENENQDAVDTERLGLR
jgi:ATP-binding cassette subfamily B protein